MTSSLKLFIILYYIKQIDSKLPCVCSVIDHRGRQNVVRTSVIHSAAPRMPLFCSYHLVELVEQAFNAHSMKLAKVSEEESENENLIMAELFATDEGVLPDPASLLKSNCSRNLTIFPEFTSPDICNYLLGKQVI